MARWFASLGIFAAAVVPSVTLVWSAAAINRPPTVARDAILAAIPTQPSALINVSRADMPASPDILQLGKRSTAALQQCLANNQEADLRSYCADLIGLLADRSALPALWIALEDWDATVRSHVIDALARIPDARSLPKLLTAFDRPDEGGSNRNAILKTLGALGDRRAIDVLRRELRKPSHDVQRIVAFRALWRSRSLMTRSALIEEIDRAIRSDDSAVSYAAILRASELRSPNLVPALLQRMKDTDTDTRNKAVYALGLTGDPRAAGPLRALLVETRDARMLNNIAFALERLDKAAFFAEIGRLAAHPQAIIRLNASFVLGDIRRKDAMPLLANALKDASAQVKLQAMTGLRDSPAEVAPLFEHELTDPRLEVQRAAIDALASRGRAQSITQLETLILDPERDTSLREEAIFAAHQIDPNRSRELVFHTMFVHGDARQRKRAAIALGAAGDPRMTPYLMACLERRECALSDVASLLHQSKDLAIAGRVLRAWAEGRRELAPLVAQLRPAGTSTLALADLDVAIAGSGHKSLSGAIKLIADLQETSARDRLAKLQPKYADQRLRIDVARARLGDAAADRAVLRALEESPAEWLPSMVRVVRAIPEPTVRARLAPALEQRFVHPEFATSLSAAAVLLDWQPQRGMKRLIDAMHSPRILERELALRYLRMRPTEANPLLALAMRSERDDHVKEELRKLLEGAK